MTISFREFTCAVLYSSTLGPLLSLHFLLMGSGKILGYCSHTGFTSTFSNDNLVNGLASSNYCRRHSTNLYGRQLREFFEFFCLEQEFDASDFFQQLLGEK